MSDVHGRGTLEDAGQRPSKKGQLVNMARLSRKLAVTGATVAVVAAGTSAVALATDSSANVYQGCLNHALGALYNVQLNPSTTPRCLPRDAAVSWNQQGPAGPTGPQGPKGEIGATGAAGPQGPKGDSGAAGPAGPQGPKGDTGAQGPAGLSTGVSAIAPGEPQLPAHTFTTVLQTPPVPTTGVYYLSGSLTVNLANGDTVSCMSAPNGNGKYGSEVAQAGPAPNNEYAPLPIAQAIPLNAGDSISILCQDSNDDPSTSLDIGFLNATLINSATGPTEDNIPPAGG